MNESLDNDLPSAEPNWPAALAYERTSVEARWGSAVAEGGYGSGWTAVPSAFIRNIAWFGLRPTEVTVLIAVLMHYWSRDRMPFPRVATMARNLGINRRTVERTLRSLEERKLIIWEKSTDTPYGKRRVIDLSPLIAKVEVLATQKAALTQPKIVDFDKVKNIASIDEEGTYGAADEANAFDTTEVIENIDEEDDFDDVPV